MENIFLQNIDFLDNAMIFFIWASLVAQLVKNLPAMQETPIGLLDGGNSPREGKGYPLQHSWAFLVFQTVKNLSAMWETWVQSLQYSHLENPHGLRSLRFSLIEPQAKSLVLFNFLKVIMSGKVITISFYRVF